ncbi:MAG: class I SAM-dependent methyltransferase [Planctomycetes bacterium]|nr:class I SAM-dependent methyltransferase [Planctomycetota bacterium]
MTLHSLEFFETQFRRQVAEGELALNLFEERSLPHLRGRVLDLGCGLGNLSLAAARRGCQVHAVDGSTTAIAHLGAEAARDGLALRAEQADLARWQVPASYEAIVSIGLLMFFPRERALALLEDVLAHVEPGGTLVLNALVEGTSFHAMFEPGAFYLFGRGELEERSRAAGFLVLHSMRDEVFAAPGGTEKRFDTLIAGAPPSR